MQKDLESGCRINLGSGYRKIWKVGVERFEKRMHSDFKRILTLTSITTDSDKSRFYY